MPYSVDTDLTIKQAHRSWGSCVHSHKQYMLTCLHALGHAHTHAYTGVCLQRHTPATDVGSCTDVHTCRHHGFHPVLSATCLPPLCPVPPTVPSVHTWMEMHNEVCV